MDPVKRLRERLTRPGMIQAPGCYDAFSALLIQQAGFEAAYMTGFGASASLLGQPDVGLISFAEMADHAARIANLLEIPLIADADTGYGSGVNTYRTVRGYARAGVAAIQLEDQVSPKRCGHTPGKAVVPVAEMVGKLKAAADARSARDIVVIARTDARAVTGMADALERCQAYREAGADVIFFEAPQTEAEMALVCREVRAPLLINQVEGGQTPFLAKSRLEALGFRLAIYPVTLLLTAARGMTEQLAELRKADTFEPFDRQITFENLRATLGFPEFYAREARYKA